MSRRHGDRGSYFGTVNLLRWWAWSKLIVRLAWAFFLIVLTVILLKWSIQ